MKKTKNQSVRKTHTTSTILVFLLILFCASGCMADEGDESDSPLTITDAFGRSVTIPDNPERIAVCGSGSMRFFIYLDIDLDRVVAIDYLDSELNNYPNDLRPYMLSHPEIKSIPEIGLAKGVVDNEKLLFSNAEVLFIGASDNSSIEMADEIMQKTGIPVVLFYVGNYVTHSDEIQKTLIMLGEILHHKDRAEEVITYFNEIEADLKERVPNASEDEKPTVYVGGVAYSGSHGIDGTDPTYYPFTVLNARNVASDIEKVLQTGYVQVAKEQILAWDPDIIFVDLATLGAAEGGAIVELQTDPSYQELSAVKNGEIYAVNPHTSMNVNYETTLANAYYIGSILYPEQFSDIDPAKKADEIYRRVVGREVFEQLKANVEELSYQKLTL